MRLIFEAKGRDDGTMFVTCAELPFFSAVAVKDDWQHIFELARMHMAMNGPGGLRSDARLES